MAGKTPVIASQGNRQSPRPGCNARSWRRGLESQVLQRRETLAAQFPRRPLLERDPNVHAILMGQSAERLLRERARALLA
jgi:hypothetical protein